MCPRTKPALRGICLLNGQHPPGSQLARECPALRAKVGSGLSGEKKSVVTPNPLSEEPLEPPRPVQRPSKVPLEVQLAKARERARKRRMPR